MAMTKRDFLIAAAAASGGAMLSRFDAFGQAERRCDRRAHPLVSRAVGGAGAERRRGRRRPHRRATTVAASHSTPEASARCSARTTSISKAASNPWTRPASTHRCFRSWAPWSIGRRRRSGSSSRRSTMTPARRAHRNIPTVSSGSPCCRCSSPNWRSTELERAGTLPGLRGVMMATAINGKNLDDKSFFSILPNAKSLAGRSSPIRSARSAVTA